MITSAKGTGEITMSTAVSSYRTINPLTWRPGDQWSFRYFWGESPERKREFVWIVAADNVVDGELWYVVRVESRLGSKEMVFVKKDNQLGWHMEKGSNGYRKRASPANFYLAWPLRVGESWHYTYFWEDSNGRRQQARTCTVEEREDVTVPAGTFQTFRVVCRNQKDKVLYKYWFAEAVNMFVQDQWYFKEPGKIRHRELTRYMLTAEPAPQFDEGDDGGGDGDAGGDDGGGSEQG
jgi:hypothetical protein